MSCKAIAKIEKQDLEPQRTRRNTEEKRDGEPKSHLRMRGKGRNIQKAQQIPDVDFTLEAVPIWEMLNGGEMHG